MGGAFPRCACRAGVLGLRMMWLKSVETSLIEVWRWRNGRWEKMSSQWWDWRREWIPNRELEAMRWQRLETSLIVLQRSRWERLLMMFSMISLGKNGRSEVEGVGAGLGMGDKTDETKGEGPSVVMMKDGLARGVMMGCDRGIVWTVEGVHF